MSAPTPTSEKAVSTGGPQPVGSQPPRRGFRETLGVEFLRLRLRRSAQIIIVVGLLGLIGSLALSVANAAPPSAAERAEAQAQVDRELADVEFTEYREQLIAECLAAVEAGGTDEFPSEYYPSAADCEDTFAPPTIENYLYWSEPSFIDEFTTNLLSVTGITALVMALLGITFIGAEFAAGTIETQLTFQPNRRAVFRHKATAIGVVGLVMGVIGAVLAWAAAYFVSAQWGNFDMADTFLHNAPLVERTNADVVWRAVRAVVFVIAAGVGGFALATITRNSAFAIGVIFAELIVVEGVLRGLASGISPYLPTSRLFAWIVGPYDVVQFPDRCMDSCEPTITTITATGGGIYLGVVLLVIVVGSMLLFQRRDVRA